MLGMLFAVFPLISTHISLVLFSPETDIGRSRILNDHLMAICARNIVSKLLKIDIPSSSDNRKCSGCFFSEHSLYVKSSYCRFSPDCCIDVYSWKANAKRRWTNIDWRSIVSLTLCLRPTLVNSTLYRSGTPKTGSVSWRWRRQWRRDVDVSCSSNMKLTWNSFWRSRRRTTASGKTICAK